MNYYSDVQAVDSHAERGCGHHYTAKVSYSDIKCRQNLLSSELEMTLLHISELEINRVTSSLA